MKSNDFDRIISEHQRMRKVSARWVPKFFTRGQNMARRKMSRDNLHEIRVHFRPFLRRFIAEDETCGITLQHSNHWNHSSALSPEKVKSVPLTGKVVTKRE